MRYHRISLRMAIIKMTTSNTVGEDVYYSIGGEVN